jgi:hypothetical protein
MTNYKNMRCWKCKAEIVVALHDLAERNYCTPCAWDKLMLVSDNQTVGKDVQ